MIYEDKKLWYIKTVIPNDSVVVAHDSCEGDYRIRDSSWTHPRFCFKCQSKVPDYIITQAYLLL